ncbi:MAG: DUF3667 domain-containing protein [Parvularculaceae bacterium]|nr:DUF3667 domain-containing protein [Parvularculaceae bacterium]
MAKKPRRRKPIDPKILGDGVNTCLACGSEIHGPWCHVCGQKNDDCRRSITRLAAEVVRDTAAIDSRFWRTWRSMLTRPGAHIQDYAHGRRSPFTPPVRFFFVLLFVFFFSLWFTERNILVFQLVPEFPDDEEVAALELPEERGTRLFLEAEIGPDDEPPAEDAEPPATPDTPDTPNPDPDAATTAAEAELDQILNALPEDLSDAIREELADVEGLEDLEELSDEARDLFGDENFDRLLAAANDQQEKAPGPKIRPYGGVFVKARDLSFTEEERQWFRDMVDPDTTIGIFGSQLGGEQLAEALIFTMQNPSAFNNALNEAIPILLLLFVPFMAVLGAVFIRGEDALIYDHLLVSIQTHAIAFLILTVGVLTIDFIPGELVALVLLIGMPTYYTLALKGAFQRSWRKTIVATLFVGWNYNFFFIFGLLGAVLFAVLEIS